MTKNNIQIVKNIDYKKINDIINTNRRSKENDKIYRM